MFWCIAELWFIYLFYHMSQLCWTIQKELSNICCFLCLPFVFFQSFPTEFMLLSCYRLKLNPGLIHGMIPWSCLAVAEEMAQGWEGAQQWGQAQPKQIQLLTEACMARLHHVLLLLAASWWCCCIRCLNPLNLW